MINSTSIYELDNGEKILRFDSEKSACEYLGVGRSIVASCYRTKCKCKGYVVRKIGTTTHKETKTRLFKIWSSMHERCERKKHPHYGLYGGRGVLVCDEWSEYVPFAEWAKSNGYEDHLTIDRIDPDGNYTPDNCRWVTMKDQQNNKRNNRRILFNGKVYTLTQLAETFGIKKTTLKERLNAGWSVEDAVFKPIRKRTVEYCPSSDYTVRMEE